MLIGTINQLRNCEFKFPRFFWPIIISFTILVCLGICYIILLVKKFRIRSFRIGCWIWWARYLMNIYFFWNQGRVSCLVPQQLVLVHFRLIDYVSNHKLTNNMFQIEVTVITFYCSICHFFLNNIFWEKWKSEKIKLPRGLFFYSWVIVSSHIAPWLFTVTDFYQTGYW